MPKTANKHLRWNYCFPDANQIVAILVNEHPDYPPHDHNFMEVVVVADGSCLQETALGKARIARGAVSIFRPGAWHAYTQCQNLTVFNCCFNPGLLGRELGWMIDDPMLGRLLWSIPLSSAQHGTSFLRLRNAELKRSQKLLKELCILSIKSKTNYRIDLLGLLVQLLGILARHLPVEATSKSIHSNSSVTITLKLIDENPAHTWTLKDLAARAHVPPAYLVRLFSKVVGLPPMAYLRRRRLELATRFLIQSAQPISEIGELVGWPDANYFTRRFRTEFGLPPMAYRRRYEQVSKTSENDAFKLHNRIA